MSDDERFCDGCGLLHIECLCCPNSKKGITVYECKCCCCCKLGDLEKNGCTCGVNKNE